MTDQPPPPGGYPPPPPPGGYPPPPGGGYPPPPPPGGGYPPPPGPGGYRPPPPPGGYPPPPPSGGYPPPPPPGGYPPPPPPGGGYAPPPTPVGGYQAPGYGTQPELNIGEGFSWAWNKFTQNAVPLIVAAVICGVIVSVINGIVYGLAIALAPSTVTSYDSSGNGFEYSTSASFGLASILVLVVGVVLLLVVVAALQSAYLSGILDIANGQPVTIGSFLKPRSVGNVIVATLIISIAVSIGYALCVIPGLAVALLTFFAVIALLDRNLAPVDAIKTSFEVVKANLVPTLLVWLSCAAIGVVGLVVCFVGLFVALPVAALLQVYAWRRLSGGQIAALNPQPLPPGPQQQFGPPAQ